MCVMRLFMPDNYTFQEYLLLIAMSDNVADLELVDELLLEDRANRVFNAFEYIDIRAAFILRLTRITIDEGERQL